MWQELGVPLKNSLKNIKEKKSVTEKNPAAQIKQQAVRLFHTVILTAASFTQRTSFWGWSLWFLCSHSVVLETLCILGLLLVTVLTRWGTQGKAHRMVLICRCQRWPVITVKATLWESGFFISLMEKGKRKIYVDGCLTDTIQFFFKYWRDLHGNEAMLRIIFKMEKMINKGWSKVLEAWACWYKWWT